MFVVTIFGRWRCTLRVCWFSLIFFWCLWKHLLNHKYMLKNSLSSSANDNGNPQIRKTERGGEREKECIRMYVCEVWGLPQLDTLYCTCFRYPCGTWCGQYFYLCVKFWIDGVQTSHMGDTQAEIYLNTETTSTAANEVVQWCQEQSWALCLSHQHLNSYNVPSHSFGPRVTAHLANNSWAQFRSWHWPGIIPNGNLDAATLIWRVREFNSMDRLCAIWPQSQSWTHLIHSYVYNLWLLMPSHHGNQAPNVFLFSKSS